MPSSYSLRPRLMRTQARAHGSSIGSRRRGGFRQMGSHGSLRQRAGPRAEDEEERGEGGRARRVWRSGPLRTSILRASGGQSRRACRRPANSRSSDVQARCEYRCGQPRDHLGAFLALQRAGPHKQAARTSERLSRTSPSVSHSQSQRAGSAAAARPTPPACHLPC